jgi:hypothetical protein
LIKQLRRENNVDQEFTSELFNSVNIYFTSEWIFSLLDLLAEAVENKEEKTILTVYTELSKILTPFQNEIFIELLETSKATPFLSL